MLNTWLWRAGAALIGTWGYYRLNAPDWRNPYHLFYDLPLLPLAFGTGGARLVRLLNGGSGKEGLRLAALLVATGFAAGAQYRAWPLSGHLTVATTLTCLESTDPENPFWLRLITPLPVFLITAIRTFRPQSALMGNTFNTLSGLLIGALIGGGTLLLLGRLKGC